MFVISCVNESMASERSEIKAHCKCQVRFAHHFEYSFSCVILRIACKVSLLERIPPMLTHFSSHLRTNIVPLKDFFLHPYRFAFP